MSEDWGQSQNKFKKPEVGDSERERWRGKREYVMGKWGDKKYLLGRGP